MTRKMVLNAKYKMNPQEKTDRNGNWRRCQNFVFLQQVADVKLGIARILNMGWTIFSALR
jgi:hypothetical protein